MTPAAQAEACCSEEERERIAKAKRRYEEALKKLARTIGIRPSEKAQA